MSSFPCPTLYVILKRFSPILVLCEYCGAQTEKIDQIIEILQIHTFTYVYIKYMGIYNNVWKYIYLQHDRTGRKRHTLGHVLVPFSWPNMASLIFSYEQRLGFQCSRIPPSMFSWFSKVFSTTHIFPSCSIGGHLDESFSCLKSLQKKWGLGQANPQVSLLPPPPP